MNNYDIREEILSQSKENVENLDQYIKAVISQNMEEALRISLEILECDKVLLIRGIIRLLIFPVMTIIKIRKENLWQIILRNSSDFFSSKTMILDQNNLIKSFIAQNIEKCKEIMERMGNNKKSVTINTIDSIDDWKTNMAHLNLFLADLLRHRILTPDDLKDKDEIEIEQFYRKADNYCREMLRERGKTFVASFIRSKYPLDVLEIQLQLRLNIATFYHENSKRSMKGLGVLRKTKNLFEEEMRCLIDQWPELAQNYWARRIMDTFYLINIQSAEW